MATLLRNVAHRYITFVNANYIKNINTISATMFGTGVIIGIYSEYNEHNKALLQSQNANATTYEKTYYKVRYNRHYGVDVVLPGLINGVLLGGIATFIWPTLIPVGVAYMPLYITNKVQEVLKSK